MTGSTPANFSDPPCLTSSRSRRTASSNPAAYGPGYLEPRYAPLIVGDNAAINPRGADATAALKVEDIDLPADVDQAHAGARLDLLNNMEKEFLARHSDLPALSPRRPMTVPSA